MNEILITTGANEGILSIILAYINPGDEVIIIEPLFDQYETNIILIFKHLELLTTIILLQ